MITPVVILQRLLAAIALVLMIGAPSFAQRPLLSPRDSIETSLQGKRIQVDYGRPSMRGRKIMGGLVPYNRWWRTGANEATSFRTEADLLLGDSLVPAGDYTLYTLPSEQRWMLIINRQTGQWGTVYNPDLDLVRIPLQRGSLEQPEETFLIRIEPTDSVSGTLHLLWETTDLSVPFRAVPARTTREGGGG
jgi:hypothetical protein